LIAYATPIHAQGFAGLGSDPSGFALPQRSTALAFPVDHGPHPDFRIEWWYLTANLTATDGQEYGMQWTLFRTALRPDDRIGWHSPQLWMGHAAITSADAHHVSERLARGGIGQAGVRSDPFEAWIDDWTMSGANDLSDLILSANGPDFSYELTLTTQSPLVLHGDGGYSVKSAVGQASHYYSQPAYSVAGTLNLPAGPVQVTGNGWLDREWSSQPLAEDQTGWDWFSLSFDSGARMMGFRLRSTRDDFTAATWITPDGHSFSLPDGALQTVPLDYAQVAGRRVPVRWNLSLPARNLDVEISALNPQSWMKTSVPYWEGPVRVTGSHPGRGYLEMTGYNAPN